LSGVHVVSGAAPSVTLYSLKAQGAFFGERMAKLPDLDCDGIGEIAVAARDCATSGALFVYSGADGKLLSAATPPEQQLGERFGRSLAVVDDADSDGAELLVGATGRNSNQGAVFQVQLPSLGECKLDDR